ncbi:putative quinol monooxygenase [Paenibacillus physcomitrellae]|uniref:Monooxygenase n=1 Tax=Paenibacillus physcomitrellae TaxID=1619311 RepID=A0ABQ1FRX7_9BACL|nr:putative quinol monooxygenase [Paenibacillus physcomitrellae]GGA27210.1 monooxygenase [Paenibacillus physcomitrellae]
MIMIQAHFYVHPSEREDFLEQAGILQRKTREESGNLCSLLYEAVEEPNTFVWIEKWEDQEAVNRHNNTDHFVGFYQIADGYLVRPIKAEVHEVPDAETAATGKPDAENQSAAEKVKSR